MYITPIQTSLMTWHVSNRSGDGLVWHVANSMQWQFIDENGSSHFLLKAIFMSCIHDFPTYGIMEG
jgi:hypothetical protein